MERGSVPSQYKKVCGKHISGRDDIGQVMFHIKHIYNKKICKYPLQVNEQSVVQVKVQYLLV